MDLEGFSKPQYVVASTPWKEVNGSEAVFLNITESKVFVLQYELAEDVEPVVITVDGIENEFAYNQVVTITSELEDFSHWEEDGVIVSYDREYKFTALVNRNLVAKTDSTPKPLISLINATGIKEGYKSFLGQFYLPNGYKLIEAGVLASNEEKVLFLDSDNTTVVKSTSILESTNEFLRSFPEDSFTTFRGYMVVKDSEDEIKVIYSDNNYFFASKGIEGATYTETFANLNLGGSYVSGTFIGVNDQVWTYADSRGDRILDGKALTFKEGSLKTTFTNGLSLLEFDYRRDFSNNDARNFEVYINNELIDEITVIADSDTRGHYLKNNLSYEGTVELEIKGTGAQKLIDNIKWSELSDIVTEVVKLYSVEFITNDTYLLASVREGNNAHKPTDPSKPNYEFIGWYENEDFTGEKFNFESKINSHIKLYAKFEEIPVSTISEIKSLPIDSNVITKGIVTSLIGNSAFIQDNTGGIYLYLGENTSYASILVVGNEVLVSGKMGKHNDQIQITSIDNIELLNENQDLPAAVVIEELDLDDILEQQGKLITINGLTIKSIPTIGTAAYSVVVTDGTVDLEIRVDQYISTFAEVKALFEGAYVGQGINLVNIPVGRFKEKPQVMASLVSQLVLQPLSQELLESILEDELNPGVVTTEDLNLLTSIKISNTTYSVTWSSDNPAITNMGIVTRPEAGEDDVVVTLTAIVRNFENETVTTLTYGIIVHAEVDDITPIEVIFKKVSSNYTTTANDATNSIASKLTNDPNINVYAIKGGTSSYMALRTDDMLRLYANKTDGNGNTLVIEMKSGYKITSINITFYITNECTFSVIDSNGSSISLQNGVTTDNLNTNKISIKNTHKTSGSVGQLRITGISITYIPG